LKIRTTAAALALSTSALLPGCGGPPPSRSAPPVSPSASVEPPRGVRDLPDSAYRVEWGELRVPATLKPAEAARVRVGFKNVSDSTWPYGGGTGGMLYTIRLTHRWLKPSAGSEAREVIGYGDRRAELPHPVRPGESVALDDTLTAPAEPGRYLVQFDLIHEGVAYFESKGAARKTLAVIVQ
jgi:hypothetical protein